jgi:transposase-like protein
MVTNTTATVEVVETGQKRDRLGRKITPSARRAELVAGWRQSGQTQAEFARAEGINYSTFASWVQEERKAAGARRAAKPVAPVRFAQVRLPAVTTMAGGVEVRLPDGTLVRGTDASELAKLLRALRA